MFRKILVPTDGSSFSQKAYQTAIEIGEASAAEIILLHVLYLPSSYWGYNDPFPVILSQEEMDEGSENVLVSTVKDVTGQNVRVRRMKKEGYPAKVILEIAQKEEVDLIVMGSHGYGPLSGTVLGSVSQRVLYGAACPVLIVKQEGKAHKPNEEENT